MINKASPNPFRGVKYVCLDIKNNILKFVTRVLNHSVDRRMITNAKNSPSSVKQSIPKRLNFKPHKLIGSFNRQTANGVYIVGPTYSVNLINVAYSG